MVGMGIHFPCNEKDCVIPKPHYKSEHDPARRGEGAHECSHDFFAGVCRICGTPQPAAQEAERAFEEEFRAHIWAEPSFTALEEQTFRWWYVRGYRRGFEEGKKWREDKSR